MTTYGNAKYYLPLHKNADRKVYQINLGAVIYYL
jgi:hypothetical protein